jgi:hypothetical protein
MSSTALSTFLPAFSNGPSLQHDSPTIRAIIANTADDTLTIFHHLYLLSRMDEHALNLAHRIVQ